MSAQPLEIRMARLEGGYEQIDHRLAELRQDLDRHFSGIGERFSQIDRRFSQIDQRFSQIDQRFIQVEQRFIQMDQRFMQIDQKFTWVMGLIIGTWSTTMLAVLLHR